MLVMALLLVLSLELLVPVMMWGMATVPGPLMIRIVRAVVARAVVARAVVASKTALAGARVARMMLMAALRR